MYINPEDLEWYRNFHKGYFDKKAYKITVSYAPDGVGGQIKTTSVATVPFDAMVRVSNADESAIASKLTNEQSYTITLPYGSNVAIKDLLRIDNKDFEIIGIMGEPDTYSIEYSILAILL